MAAVAVLVLLLLAATSSHAGDIAKQYSALSGQHAEAMRSVAEAAGEERPRRILEISSQFQHELQGLAEQAQRLDVGKQGSLDKDDCVAAARVCERLGRSKESLRYANVAFQNDPSFREAVEIKFRALVNLGRVGEAEAMLGAEEKHEKSVAIVGGHRALALRLAVTREWGRSVKHAFLSLDESVVQVRDDPRLFRAALSDIDLIRKLRLVIGAADKDVVVRLRQFSHDCHFLLEQSEALPTEERVATLEFAIHFLKSDVDINDLEVPGNVAVGSWVDCMGRRFDGLGKSSLQFRNNLVVEFVRRLERSQSRELPNVELQFERIEMKPPLQPVPRAQPVTSSTLSLPGS